MSGPVLSTERLRLRPFASEDVDALHAQWTQPDVRRYLWDGRAIERDEVVNVVEESLTSFETRRYGFWVLEYPGARSIVGFTGFRTMPDSTELELYYGLDREHWGSGFATEAAREMVRYGFDVLELDHIYIRTDGPNEASVRVMQRLGASYVRTDPTGAFGSTIVYVMERPQ